MKHLLSFISSFHVIHVFEALTNGSNHRKKYRKMRIKFEDVMGQSNILFKNEQSAAETARRIALENEWVPKSTLIAQR